MKSQVLQEELNKGISVVSRFVATRPQLPVLANILINADKNNQLKLSATNLEIGIQSWFGAKVEEEGQLVIPARELGEFISYLSVGKLSLQSEKKMQLKVKSNGGQATFAGMDAGDFPKIIYMVASLAAKAHDSNADVIVSTEYSGMWCERCGGPN